MIIYRTIVAMYPLNKTSLSIEKEINIEEINGYDRSTIFCLTILIVMKYIKKNLWLEYDIDNNSQEMSYKYLTVYEICISFASK